MSKKVVIFGSTGTLGKKAFEISLNLGYKIVGLTAYKNVFEIKKQMLLSNPSFVAVDEQFLGEIEEPNTKTYSLNEVHEHILEYEPDIVLFLASGITSAKTIKVCLEKGIRIGIANKESIIAFGEVLFENKNFGDLVIPVDSETSGIFQVLLGERKEDLERIIITASGGPFFNKKRDDLEKVSVKDVLNHPNWRMGSKITVDSANLVNKAFEVIETHFLFNVPYSKIDAVIHRESVIHAMAEFKDGEIKALLSTPDMAIPIQYSLTYPERKENNIKHLDLVSLGKLTFYEIDRDAFPLFDTILSYAMLGGNYLPSIVAIDEALVESFLSEEISFLDIEKYLIDFLGSIEFQKINSLEEGENVYNNTKNKILEILRRK